MNPARKRPSAERLAPTWSGTYRGRQIAAVRDDDAWFVVLDNVLQCDHEFESSEEAAAWLRRAIDSQIAEAIFPGLAFN